MFSDVIKSAVPSLIPFWSNGLVKSFSLGNEYTMAMNMIMNEIVKIVGNNLTDFHSFVLIFIIFIVGLLYKSGKVNKLKGLFREKKYVVLDGSVKNILTVPYIIGSDAFKCINNVLVKKHKFKNVLYVNENTIVVNNTVECEIDKDLYISVESTSESENTKIKITICSYNRNIGEYIEKQIKESNIHVREYQLKFVGTEQNETKYEYSDEMICMTQALIKLFGMHKLKILSDGIMY